MDFQNLKQGDKTVHKYWEKFTRLLKYVPPYQQDKNLKVRKFIMGLNNKIGAVDVLTPRTMEEALEKVVRQEYKIKMDDSIWDNKRKTNWNREGADTGSEKKQFKDFRYSKPDSKGNGVKDVKSNFSTSKNNKSNEKKGPPSGCYNCGGDYYVRKCPVKPNTNQLQRPPLPQQQFY